MPPALADRLFFAIRPASAAVQQIGALQQRLRTTHGVRGRVIAAERLHVTLQMLGDFPAWPAALIETASAAAAALEFPAFEVCFDRLACFPRPRDVPVVLRGGKALAALEDFQQRLVDALAAAGLPPQRPGRFIPHVTLFYAQAAVPDEPVEPITWTARGFELVHSAIGRNRHTTLARWPLGR